MRPNYPKGSVSLFFVVGHSKARPPGNKAFYTFSSVQAGWYLHDQAGPYVLHPISQKLPQMMPLNQYQFWSPSTKAPSYPFKSFASDKHKGSNSFYTKMLRKKHDLINLGTCQNDEQNHTCIWLAHQFGKIHATPKPDSLFHGLHVKYLCLFVVACDRQLS